MDHRVRGQFGRAGDQSVPGGALFEQAGDEPADLRHLRGIASKDPPPPHAPVETGQAHVSFGRIRCHHPPPLGYSAFFQNRYLLQSFGVKL